MQVTVFVREEEELSPHSWRCRVSAQHQNGAQISQHLVQVDNPLNEADEEELRWYLEEHSEVDPFDSGRAASAGQLVRRYVQSLAVCLQLGRPIVASSIQDAQRVVVVIVSSRYSAMMKLRWELLEACESLSNVTLYRNITTEPPSNTQLVNVLQLDQAARKEVRILLITARPGGVNDLGHRILSRPLVELCRQLRDRAILVKVHVVQPGSWAALCGHLSETSAYHGAGFYHLIHVDAHGLIKGDKTYLALLSTSGRSAVHVTAEDLGACLRKHGIASVVMNSCQGATVVRGTRHSFAEALLSAGVTSVVGMAYACSGATAELFFKYFYQSLLENGLDLATAVATARRAMRNDKQRPGRFGTAVKVDDHAVPVLYSSLAQPDMPRFLSPPVEQENIMSRLWKAAYSTVTSHLPSNPFNLDPEADKSLEGREGNVLDIESLLLSKTPRSLLLVHGIAGIGKTSLLRHLCWWWKETHTIQDALYINCDGGFGKNAPRSFASSLLLDAGAAGRLTLRPDIKTLLQNHRFLIVIDELNAGTNATFSLRARWSQDDRDDLKQLVHELRQTKALTILASRSLESWLGSNDEIARYRLDGLSYITSSQIVTRRLPESVRLNITGQKQERDCLERIILAAEGSFAALDLFLYDVRTGKQPPSTVYNDLRLGVPKSIGGQGLLTFQGPYRSSIRLISTANDAFLTFAKRHPWFKVVLLSLCYFRRRFREDWFQFILEYWPLHIRLTLTGADLPRFMEAFREDLMDLGWIWADTNFRPTKRGPHRYFCIHPVFSCIIRERSYAYVSAFGFTDEVQRFFLIYFSQRVMYEDMGQETFRRMRMDFIAEFDNFTTAATIGLRLMRQSSDRSESLDVLTFNVISRLWAFSATEDVDRDVVLDLCRDYLKFHGVQAEASSLGTEDHSIYAMPAAMHAAHISNCLAEYYLESRPSLAERYSSAALSVLSRVSNPTRNLERETQTHLCQATLLHGLSLLGLGRFVQGHTAIRDAMDFEMDQDDHSQLVKSWVRSRGLLSLLETRELTLPHDQLRAEVKNELDKVGRHAQGSGYGMMSTFASGVAKDLEALWHAAEIRPHELYTRNRTAMVGSLANASVFPALSSLSQAERLIQNSDLGGAKSVLLNGLARAVATNNATSCGVYYSKLIGVCRGLEDWNSCALYVKRYLGLESDRQGGYWGVRGTPLSISTLYSDWCLCCMRAAEFELAGRLATKAFGDMGRVQRALEESHLDTACGVDLAALRRDLDASCTAPGDRVDAAASSLMLRAMAIAGDESNAEEAEGGGTPQVDMEAWLKSFAEIAQGGGLSFDNMGRQEQLDILGVCLGWELRRGKLEMGEFRRLGADLMAWAQR